MAPLRALLLRSKCRFDGNRLTEVNLCRGVCGFGIQAGCEKLGEDTEAAANVVFPGVFLFGGFFSSSSCCRSVLVSPCSVVLKVS